MAPVEVSRAVGVCRPSNRRKRPITFACNTKQRWCRLWIKGRPFHSIVSFHSLGTQKIHVCYSKPCRAFSRRAPQTLHYGSPASARQTNFFRTKCRLRLGWYRAKKLEMGRYLLTKKMIGDELDMCRRPELPGRKKKWHVVCADISFILHSMVVVDSFCLRGFSVPGRRLSTFHVISFLTCNSSPFFFFLYFYFCIRRFALVVLNLTLHRGGYCANFRQMLLSAE